LRTPLPGVSKTLLPVILVTNANAKPQTRVADSGQTLAGVPDNGKYEVTAGTVLVKNIGVGSHVSSNPTSLTNVNGTLFFSGSDGTSKVGLYTSDGTEAGTALVKEFQSEGGGSIPIFLTNANGTLFFVTNDGTHGRELWKSDGTESGTVLVKDILEGFDGSFPRYLTDVNGTVFFQAKDSSGRPNLWKSDGTEAGTVLLKDPGGELDRDASPKYLTNVNGTLFFNGSLLWMSDGTAAGTALMKETQTGGNIAYPASLSNVNGRLFFRGFDTTYGRELWVAEATPVEDLLWHNAAQPLDVNGDEAISSSDALAVINRLNAFGAGAVTANSEWDGAYYDVNGDNSVSPADALDVINYINAGLGGEGEGFAAGVSDSSSGANNPHLAAAMHDDWTDLLTLLSLDTAQQTASRRNLQP